MGLPRNANLLLLATKTSHSTRGVGSELTIVVLPDKLCDMNQVVMHCGRKLCTD